VIGEERPLGQLGSIPPVELLSTPRKSRYRKVFTPKKNRRSFLRTQLCGGRKGLSLAEVSLFWPRLLETFVGSYAAGALAGTPDRAA
jgi:hypothetical protein